MRVVVILKDMVERLTREKGRQGLLNYFNAGDFSGEDTGMVAKRPLSDQLTVKEMVTRYRDFRFDDQGNITAEVIFYGWLRDTQIENHSFVMRAFQDKEHDKFFVAAIDVNVDGQK